MPGDAALVDPGNFSDAEREQRGIQRFPTTQAEALDALEQDEVLMAALGPQLATAYLAVKRSEYAAFVDADVTFEVRHHIEKF